MNSLYPEFAAILAPLSGYTDLPFRRQCRWCGCHYAFTPLIDVGSVAYGNPRSAVNLLRGDDEPWLGVQILGSDPELVEKCMMVIRDRDFQVVDFNLGCPVPKVTRRGAGAAMSDNPELAVRCLEAMIKHSPWPATAKIRILDDGDPLPTVRFARRLAETGIQALTIHGRIRERIYAGPVRSEIMAAVRESLAIPVIANGGVLDSQSALGLRESSGCSRLMIARGAIGNPWIFREMIDPESPPPTHLEICQAMRSQVLEMIQIYGEDAGLRNARKIILAYLVGRGYRRQRRHQVTSLATAREFADFYEAVLAEGPVA